MAETQLKTENAELPRIKLTARLTLPAYEALVEIQRRHRSRTGRALPLWKILDAAVIAYAQTFESRVGGS